MSLLCHQSGFLLKIQQGSILKKICKIINHQRIASLIDTIGIEEREEINTIKIEENQGKIIVRKRRYQILKNVLTFKKGTRDGRSVGVGQIVQDSGVDRKTTNVEGIGQTLTVIVILWSNHICTNKTEHLYPEKKTIKVVSDNREKYEPFKVAPSQAIINGEIICFARKMEQ